MYRMGYVCRHDEHLTLRKTINVLCDVNFRLPVQYLTYGIERRGMLAQLLSLVEREKREVTRPVMDELLTYDTAFGILDFFLGRKRPFHQFQFFHLDTLNVINHKIINSCQNERDRNDQVQPFLELVYPVVESPQARHAEGHDPGDEHHQNSRGHGEYNRIEVASRLQRRQRWTIWQYYTLGKLTHYLADAFTYPHNENYPDSMLCHHQYETDLRAYLEEYLATRALRREKFRQDVADALQELHRQYMAGVADMRKDVQFILKATSLLMAGCLPASAAAAV